MRYTVTLQALHERRIRDLVSRGDGHEGVAYVLCRRADIAHDPWTGVPELRLVSRDVVAVDDTDVLDRAVDHVTWRSATMHALLPRCQAEGLVLVLVHSHPDGLPEPSPQDDVNERTLFDYGWVRDGDDVPFGSIVVTSETIRGRLWFGWSTKPFPIDVIRVVGERFAFHRPQIEQRRSVAFARQVLAFGPALDRELAMLRVVVVGGGGTGSATVTLLTRLGVGRLAVVDPDLVEVTNLNRVHGARQADVDAGRTKAEMLSTVAAEAGLGVAIRGYANYVDDAACHDVLRSADVVFGCTDDHAGRIFLNRLAYHYALPVIDMGLIIKVDDTEVPQPRLRHLNARVTMLAPGTTCIGCRNVIDPDAAREELIRRSHPGKYARLKAEGYVRGEGNPRPAVVTFTTEVAAMAVNELLQRLGNFRGVSRDHRLRDFLTDEELSLGSQTRPGCRFCDRQRYSGMADTTSFIPGDACS